VQAMWQYYARSGDAAFLRETQAGLRKLMAGLEGLMVADLGLVDGSSLQPYVDRSRTDRDGLNCALNCFYHRALRDASRILGVLGHDRDAGEFRRRAEDLAEAIRREFWDDGAGVFVDRPKSHASKTTPSVPANALALLYDIADGRQAPRALAWLAGAMKDNFRTPEPTELSDCNVSTYFSFYALGALYKHGRAAEAQHFMRTYWGRMFDRGAWTCWEHILDTDSRCHAWSTAPTHYLSSRVLGVEFPQPGNLAVVRIRPQADGIRWARGVYPHPAGPIRVSWEIRDGKIALEFDAPDGVEVTASVPEGPEHE